MSLVPEQWEFLKDFAKLIIKAEELGFTVSGGELYRTIEQQNIYVKDGRSTTYRSKHLRRLAIDLYFFIREKNGKLKLTWDKNILQPLGDFWESLSPKNSWGGNWNSFKDVPHFERRA